MKHPLTIICLLMLLGLLLAETHADNIRKSNCPEGSRWVHSGACVANELDDDVVVPNIAPGECAWQSHTNPAGVAFCIERGKASLSIINKQYFVDEAKPQACKKDFLWWRKHQLCVERDLVFGLVQGSIKLMKPRLDCATGFEHREKWNVCTAKETPKYARDTSGLRCPIGHMLPEHEALCFENRIAVGTNETTNYGYDPSGKDCTLSMYSAVTGGFCIPQITYIFCGSNSFECDNFPGDKIRVAEGPPPCCARRNNASVVDMPSFDFSNMLKNTGHRSVITCPPPEADIPDAGKPLNCVNE